MITSEDIARANDNLKSIPVKGKNYVMVTERIKAFRQICPMGEIVTELICLEDGVVTMRTTISIDEKVVATGYAQEKETSSYINKTSFIENCETSAVGRALGFLGIGIDESMASADELVNRQAHLLRVICRKDVAEFAGGYLNVDLTARLHRAFVHQLQVSVDVIHNLGHQAADINGVGG